jgi:hypothetical protein
VLSTTTIIIDRFLAADNEKSPMHVQRPISEQPRLNPNWQERWGEPQAGFITCWERGRELAAQNSALAVAARAGALVPLSWKGGGSKRIKPNRRYGCFYYLASGRACAVKI